MSSTLLAGPPGDCCVKHVKHEGEPVGKKVEIAGIPTYLSEPASVKNGENPSKIILFYSDIFSPFFANNQLIQDFYAENGFLVLGIDYLFGDSASYHWGKPGFDVGPWALEHKKRADQVAPGWLKAVKEIYGREAKYYSVGYCFGGPFVMDTAATDEVSAAAFAHPTLVVEGHFHRLTKPLLLCSGMKLLLHLIAISNPATEEDVMFQPDARKKAEEILAGKKATYFLQLFGGVAHGFATKADLSDENQRWAKEEAANAVVRWFNRF